MSTHHSELIVETAHLQLSEKDLIFPELESIQKGVFDLYKLRQLPVFELSHQADHLSQIIQKAQKLRQDFDTLLLLGIGGSALGAQFLAEALAYSKVNTARKNFYLCDHVDADIWNLWKQEINFKKTLIVVVSKSGRTIETLSAYLFFKKALEEQVDGSSQKHFVFITDPREGLLRKIAQEESITSFDISPGIGGRYSVLTPVGLFPAAFFGVSIEELVSGGASIVEKYLTKPSSHINPPLQSALVHWAHEKKGRYLRVMFPYGTKLKSFGAWFSQLWAESLGKKYSLKGEVIHTGTTPIASVGPADQHSQLQLYLEGPDDKVITFIRSEEADRDIRLPETSLSTNGVQLKNLSVHALQKAEQQATAQALTEVERPHQTIVMRHVDSYHVGQLIVFSELETIYAGALHNINPFDQPAVELIKKNIPKFL